MKIQRFGPQFRRTGTYEVGLYVEGDPVARVHWQAFSARSYKHAELRKLHAYWELAQAAATRIQEAANRTAALARELRDWHP